RSPGLDRGGARLRRHPAGDHLAGGVPREHAAAAARDPGGARSHAVRRAAVRAHRPPDHPFCRRRRGLGGRDGDGDAAQPDGSGAGHAAAEADSHQRLRDRHAGWIDCARRVRDFDRGVARRRPGEDARLLPGRQLAAVGDYRLPVTGSLSVKFTVTVISSAVAWPFSSVGTNFHCFTAPSATSSKSGIERRILASATEPSSSISTSRITTPCTFFARASSGYSGFTSLTLVGGLTLAPTRIG